MFQLAPQLKKTAGRIRLLLTDCDGVLTDAGVYYGESGEAMKRFNIRDGMAVERLRDLAGIECGIVTGELSPSIKWRAEKLKIAELHLGAKKKISVWNEILARRGFGAEEVAYVGDDVNDLDLLRLAGLSACPADAVDEVKAIVNCVLTRKGGRGAFREFAEVILRARGLT